MMNIPTFSVSQVNRYIKSLFDSDLGMQSVFVSGEISNFSNHYKKTDLFKIFPGKASSTPSLNWIGFVCGSNDIVRIQPNSHK